MRRFGWLALILFFCTAPAFAEPLQVNTIRAKMVISFTEPSTNADASPLRDLAYSTIYYQVEADPIVNAAKIKALSPTGGSKRTKTLWILLSRNQTVVTFWVTGTDLTGNESEKSLIVVKNLINLWGPN